MLRISDSANAVRNTQLLIKTRCYDCVTKMREHLPNHPLVM